MLLLNGFANYTMLIFGLLVCVLIKFLIIFISSFNFQHVIAILSICS